MAREIPIEYRDVKVGMDVKIVQHFGESTLTSAGKVVKVEVKMREGYDVRYVDFDGIPRVDWSVPDLLKVTKAETYLLKPDLPTAVGSVVRIGTRAAVLVEDEGWIWADTLLYDNLDVSPLDLQDAEIVFTAGTLS
jgi:hypothetical protein